MLLKHCTFADLAAMSMDDVEVETRVLEAWTEAKRKQDPPGRPRR